MIKYTTEEILNLVQRSRERLASSETRELVLANSTQIDSNSREVYKDKKIKREKHISRSSEDLDAMASPSLLAEDVSCQVVVDNTSPPARTSSRVCGITAQHVITKTGIKLNVAVQTEADAVDGMYVELTAELKRHSRLRELKHYAPDDADFSELYLNTIQELKKLTPQEGQNVCLGRLHVRGARGHWFANMMVVGTLNDAGVLQQVLLHINGDEFEIILDGMLSPVQATLYHNTGIYGNITRHKSAPRLETAKRKAFK